MNASITLQPRTDMTTKSWCEPVPGQEKIAIGLQHPIDGPMKSYGAWWTDDAFTARMIVDGVVRRMPAKGVTTVKSVGPEAMLSNRRPVGKISAASQRFADKVKNL